MPSIPTLTLAPAILLGFLVRPGWDKVGVLCLLPPRPRLWQEPPALLDARGQQWTVGVSPVPTCQAASLTLDAGWSPVNPPQGPALHCRQVPGHGWPSHASPPHPAFRLAKQNNQVGGPQGLGTGGGPEGLGRVPLCSRGQVGAEGV